jgi:hypothetical protein
MLQARQYCQAYDIRVYGMAVVMDDEGLGINVTFMYNIPQVTAQGINTYFR